MTINKLILLVALLLNGCSDSTNMYEQYQQLGTETFTSEKWKSASQEERATLIYSFLTQYEINKLSREDVIALLGEPTAYFEYDEIPAYFIGSKSVSSVYGSGYLIAFPYDRTTGIVTKVIIKPKINN
ncbi:hypothetical protein [Flocculibacter collagenilyticus]|uniref:hypothetical protein n=1 Tax=Flocculibacter collagenilyticus TaxID=2744479 RepID=UPI0018F607AC|nr:hypothetical protein [Flocculibacter collagenilyticus]